MMGGHHAVSGAAAWLEKHREGKDVVAVAVSPDLGDRYLDTIYQSAWVRDIYGADALDAVERLTPPNAIVTGVR